MSKLQVNAYIGTGAVVDSEGNVKLSAADDTLLISVVAVGNGAGALAMGAAVNVNTISSQTRAYIASGATVRARGNADGISVYTGQTGAAGDLPKGAWDEDRPIDLDGDGISDVDSIDKNPDFDKDGNPDGSVNGDIKFNVGGEEIDPADQGLGAKLTEIVKGLSVTAVSNQKFITVTIAIAGAGAAGVTGAATVNTLDAVTEAYVGSGAVINNNNGSASSNQSVKILAVSNADMVMTEGSVGVAGVAGVSGSANISVINNITRAYMGGTVNAKKDIIIAALSNEDVNVITANLSGGGAAGAGAAAGVVVINGQTLAYALSSSDLKAGRDINIHAYNDGFINVDTISGAGGGAAGVGGAVVAAVITHTTRAYVENAAALAYAAKLYAPESCSEIRWRIHSDNLIPVIRLLFPKFCFQSPEHIWNLLIFRILCPVIFLRLQRKQLLRYFPGCHYPAWHPVKLSLPRHLCLRFPRRLRQLRNSPIPLWTGHLLLCYRPDLMPNCSSRHAPTNFAR